MWGGGGKQIACKNSEKRGIVQENNVAGTVYSITESRIRR